MRFMYGCLAVIFTLMIVLGGAGSYVVVQLEQKGPLEETKDIVIPKGSGAGTIAQKLEKEGVIHSAFYFRLQYYLQEHPELIAGEYLFSPRITLPEVISKMAHGDIVRRKVTVAEGKTSAEVVQLLNAEPTLKGTITKLPPEGSILPDTYQFVLGDDRNQMIKDMQKAMQDTVMEIWALRDADNPLKSPQQLVTLASIIEKETGVFTERARISGVFYNRLRRNMMLQSDPTVTYGITLGRTPLGRSLTLDDLRTPTPYNTYSIVGLPPGPITNPGKAAILAASKPEKNDFLYFVANGTGGHSFAATLAEHEKNVAAWRKLNATK